RRRARPLAPRAHLPRPRRLADARARGASPPAVAACRGCPPAAAARPAGGARDAGPGRQLRRVPDDRAVRPRAERALPHVGPVPGAMGEPRLPRRRASARGTAPGRHRRGVRPRAATRAAGTHRRSARRLPGLGRGGTRRRAALRGPAGHGARHPQRVGAVAPPRARGTDVIPITRRMTLLVTAAALVPLVVYGAVAWRTVGQATRASVVGSHQALVARGAESVTLFLEGSHRLLKAAAANLQGTNLQTWQQEAILQNYLRDVPEFRELALFDADGRVLASSRLTGTTLQPLRDTPPGEIAFQPVDVDDDLLPRTQVTLRLRDEHVAYLV